MAIDKLPLVERAARFSDLQDRAGRAKPIASSALTGIDRLTTPGRLRDRL